MNGGSGGAARIGPGDGTVQGPVDFEHAWPVPIAEQAAAIARWQRVTADALDVAWHQIEEPDARLGKLIERGDAPPCLDAAAELDEMRGEGFGDVAGAPAHHRPADGVSHHRHHQPHAGAGRAVQREHRVRRHPREQSARPLPVEGGSRQHRGGKQRGDSEGGDQERMPGQAQRPQELVEERLLVARRRGEQAAVARRVATQPGGGVVDRSLEQHGVLAVQRMRQRGRRMDELESEPSRRKVAEETG